jgi:hypothetical protein
MISCWRTGPIIDSEGMQGHEILFDKRKWNFDRDNIKHEVLNAYQMFQFSPGRMTTDSSLASLKQKSMSSLTSSSSERFSFTCNTSK